MTSTDGPQSDQPPPRPGSRRARNATPRPHRVKFFVDDQEQALLTDAARQAGMSVGTYVATAALAHAATAARPTPAEPQEFLARLVAATAAATETWRQLRTIGGLLNQVAATGNSTGALPPWTGKVLEHVARATWRVEATETELRTAVEQFTIRPTTRRTAPRRGERGSR